MDLGLFEKRWLRRDGRPKLLDLDASSADIPEPNGVIRRSPDTLSKPHICDKAKLTINGAEGSLLGVQEKLLHRHHIAGYFTPNLATSLPRLGALSAGWVWSLSHPKDASADTVPTASTTYEKIGAN